MKISFTAVSQDNTTRLFCSLELRPVIASSQGKWILDSVVKPAEREEVVPEFLHVYSHGTCHEGRNLLVLFAQKVTQIVKGLIVVGTHLPHSSNFFIVALILL